jgi:predicted membrane metal-binding protein
MAAQMVTKYPLAPRAVALVAGIAAAGFPWPLNAVIGGFSLAAGIFLRKRFQLVGLGAWFALGAALLTVRMTAEGPNDLRAIFGSDAELVTVRGVVRTDPEQRVLDRDGKTRYRTTTRVRVEEVEWRGREEKARGDVAVSTTGFLAEEFVTGATVEIFGVLERPQGPLAPGLFDFERYLKWQRVWFVLRAESTNDWKLLEARQGWGEARFYRGFNEWARKTLQRGLPDDEITRLLRAMALGWKPGLSNEVSEPFMRTGTLHLFHFHTTSRAGPKIPSFVEEC